MEKRVEKRFLPSYTNTELNCALEEIKKHGQANCCNNNQIFERAIGATYSGNYFRKSIKRSHLKKCNFLNAEFVRSAATGSVFQDCNFQDCNFIGANFQYSDFTNSKFIGNSFEATNFSESNFSNTVLENTKIISSSLSRTLFKNSIIKNCKIKSATFENTVFKDVYMENLELRNLNIDYSNFINVEMKNVILPFSQIPYTFGLLKYLLHTDDAVWISSKINDAEKISVKKYLDILKYLEVYYLSINEFFPLANIYLVKRQMNLAYQAILGGLISSINAKNFRMLKFFSKLASNEESFTNNQLADLYDRIFRVIPVENLSVSELHDYEIHIGEIRTLLLNRNHNSLRAQIILKTNIEKHNEEKIGYLLSILNLIVSSNKSQGIDLIEIRHNSPYELLIQVTQNNITQLATIVFSIYAILMKGNKIYQEFCNSILKKYEISLKKHETKKIKEQTENLEKNDVRITEINHHIFGSNNTDSTMLGKELLQYQLTSDKN